MPYTVMASIRKQATPPNERFVRPLVHLGLLLIYLAHFWYRNSIWQYCPDREKVFGPIHNSFGGRWRFLTAIVEALVSGYIIISCLTDLTSIQRVKVYLSAFCDWMFATVLWPSVLIVVIFFWSLYLYDKPLIFPAIHELCVTPLLNHGWHTLPLVALLIESTFVFHKYPSLMVAFLTMLVGSAAYIIWLLIIYYKTDRWIYPFLKDFTPVGFVSFSVVSAVVGVGFYFIGKIYRALVWKERIKALEGTIKKKEN